MYCTAKNATIFLVEEDINLETVKARSVKGVLALTGRTLILNLISLAAQAALWALLTPSQFGVFWIVSAAVSFLVYFSDIGLAAALVQKKETPTRQDLRTTFTVQQILVLLLMLILVALSPLLRQYYSLSDEGLILLYALGISFFLSSLKSIPSVLMERNLEFGKFVLPQILETLVYNISLVFFAAGGFGITSFTFAVLIRGVVGLSAVYLLKPWVPGFAFSRKSLAELLKFGLPYQINTFLAVIKDDGMTLLLGGILGSAGLGFIGMARRWSQLPLRFFMDNVTKVTFPAFSRMQDDKVALARSVTRSIFFITFLVFPSVVGLVIASPILVRVIPRYNQWIPALSALAIVSIDTLFGSITTQLTNTLNAIGKIKVTFKLMLMWTGLTLALIPFLSVRFGVEGAAVGYALVGTSSVVAIAIARHHVKFSLWEAFGKCGFATVLMAAAMLVTRSFLPVDINSLIILLAVGAVSYLASIFTFVGVSLLEDVKRGIEAIFKK